MAFGFWGVCVCVHARTRMHVHKQKYEPQHPLGIKIASRPRVIEQKAALSCVYKQAGPGPHICGPVAAAVPDQMYHTQKEPALSTEL